MIKRSLVFCLLMMMVGLTQAHKLAPSLLQLTEMTSGQFEVVWKSPKLSSAGQKLEPVFPNHCRANSEPTMEKQGTGIIWRWLISCEQPLSGETVTVRGMATTGTATLVKVVWQNGNTIQKLINARTPQMIIPEQQATGQVMAEYIALGAEHIWLGVDHLLFVLALVMLVPGTRKLVWTITAFTIGHSITLSLVSLGYMNFPVSLVEFAIALSILVLAIELASAEQSGHWISRHSWLVAVSFGLLHGMGFAGALREVGLPAADIPLALFSFNIGIELGQVAFIGLCLSLTMLFVRYAQPVFAIGRWLLVYTIGSLAGFWCIERGLSALTAV